MLLCENFGSSSTRFYEKSGSRVTQNQFTDEDLNAYFYDLPPSQIAQAPVIPRDSSRLLVLHRRDRRWEHRIFRDLPQFLDKKDLLIANNTRVIKARLLGSRVLPGKLEGGRVEFVMLEELRPRVWEGLFKASGKYVPGFKFKIPTPDGHGLSGVLIQGSAESASGTVVAEFDRDPVDSGAGEVPLPHYIQRAPQKRLPKDDEINYQTLYAKENGSAAAPTAGLHFTDRVMEGIASQGASWKEITLHVGLGTFRPVKDPIISKHIMHEERYLISPEVARQITGWKALGNRILAVGTTSVRTLESAWSQNSLNSGPGRTSLFIRPGHYQFQVVDRILTNFHLPCSTLLMLVSTFAGRELVLAAYREAVKEGYRFFSYGDAMLILE
jgi:S-adenosylmethionine:tRNA ribosyltransferase-isomerase